MKTVNKVAIADIRDALQQIEQYDDPNTKFREAWDAWKKWCLRHATRNPQFFVSKWKEGWLKKHDAAEFCNYLIKDWHPKFLDS